MYYWTPKRIKELKAAGYKLHASPASLVKKSDQAISKDASTEATSVRPGPGQKHQATSHKLPGPRPISNANKGLIHRRQASSAKLIKQQAASVKPRG